LKGFFALAGEEKPPAGDRPDELEGPPVSRPVEPARPDDDDVQSRGGGFQRGALPGKLGLVVRILGIEEIVLVGDVPGFDMPQDAGRAEVDDPANAVLSDSMIARVPPAFMAMNSSAPRRDAPRAAARWKTISVPATAFSRSAASRMSPEMNSMPGTVSPLG